MHNPFLTPSTLPYEAPPFDRIRDEHFAPAFEAAMAAHLAEIDAIANATGAPSFDNTIVAMERSGRMLTRVTLAFYTLTSANTNETLQGIQAGVAPKLAAHDDAIRFNAALFARLKVVFDRRAQGGLTTEQTALVERYHRDFVRAGAHLPDAAKLELAALNMEEASLTTDFQTRLLAASRDGALVIDEVAALDGLPAADIAAAAEKAAEWSMPGRWVLPLQNTTKQRAQALLRDRATREKLFRASTTRAERGDASDTREIVRRIAQLRARKAALLGFPTWAAYALDDQMAKTADAATKLLTDLVPAAKAKARGEAAELQVMMQADHPGTELAPWDWQYYAERLRATRYALDESQLTPYFELDRVLHDGVFFSANLLYGLTFAERTDLPVYHPDVRVFEVFDERGTAIALFYCDWLKRDNKNGGAWMHNLVGQSSLLGTKPVIGNVANFVKPAPGEPALLSFSDVTTMFHEFGHGLHGLLSDVTYPTLSGTNVPRDFVELPSQFNEHWALDPVVIANYAKHHATGEPMPADLVEKIRRTRTFDQGYSTTEYLAAALIDMAWFTLPDAAQLQDVDAFERAALTRFGIDVAEVPPRYRSSYFLHIFSHGYSAAYYAYLWAEVLDHDTFYWFKEHGGLTRENGRRFRDLILSRGATGDPAVLFRELIGRDPYVEPLLIERGLTAHSEAAAS